MARDEVGRYAGAVVTEHARWVNGTLTETGVRVIVQGAQQVSPDLIGVGFFGGYAEGYSGEGNAVFAPAITQASLSIPLISSTGATFSPVVSSAGAQQVTPGRISNIGVALAPVVQLATGAVTGIIPGLLVEFGTQAPGATLDDNVFGILDAAVTVLDMGALTWAPDITSFVRAFNVNRGGSDELQRTEAGTGSITLDNRDKRFTPLLETSPYFPEIKPTKRIRIRAVWDTTTYPVFQGFVESWPVSFPEGLDNIVTVQLVDGFELFSRATVSGDFPEQGSGARITAILSAAEWTDGMAIDTGTVTVPAVTLDNVSALEHIQSITEAELGRFFISRDGIATFKDRAVDPQGDMTVKTWADDGTGMTYRDIRPEYNTTRILNDIHLTRTGGTEQVVQSLTSKQKYGNTWRSYVKTDLQLSSDSQVLELAELLRDRYENPRLRLTQLVDNAMRHGFWDRVLARELADMVNVILSTTETEQVSAVEGIGHDYAANPGTWTVTLNVSPGVLSPLGILDDPTYGLLDSAFLA